MKIKCALLALVCLFCAPALAIMDDTPDLFGLYFDQLADINCLDGVTPYTTAQLHAIYTNPTVPEFVGFEFGMDVSSNVLLLQTINPWNPFWDPIEYPRYVVGWGTPYPLEQINILISFSLLYMDVGQQGATFSMRQADTPGGPWDTAGVILPGGTFHPVNILNGWGNVTAGINVDCVLGDEQAAWGTVKALYR